MNFVFWNVGKKDIDSKIVALAVETQPDFLVLAEYEGDPLGLLKRLSVQCPNLYLIPRIACEHITLFSTCTPGQVHPKCETSRFTIQEIRKPRFKPFLLGSVHLPSKLHADDDDQLYSAIQLRDEIEQCESDAGHRNTLVLGDFNMNPFDKGMIFAKAMNAVSSLAIAERESRIVKGQSQSFFYNPSWNLLGDFGDTPGTYYHRSPGSISLYWNTLDQVIMRPSLACALNKSSLRILRSVRGNVFVSEEGFPSVSDHLPIAFSVNLSNIR